MTTNGITPPLSSVPQLDTSKPPSFFFQIEERFHGLFSDIINNSTSVYSNGQCNVFAQFSQNCSSNLSERIHVQMDEDNQLVLSIDQKPLHLEKRLHNKEKCTVAVLTHETGRVHIITKIGQFFIADYLELKSVSYEMAFSSEIEFCSENNLIVNRLFNYNVFRGSPNRITLYYNDSGMRTYMQKLFFHEESEKTERIKRYLYREESGILMQKEEFFYDQSENITNEERFFYDEFGKPKYRQISFYDQSEIIYQENTFFYPCGQLKQRDEFRFNKFGRIISKGEIFFDKAGKITEKIFRKPQYNELNEIVGENLFECEEYESDSSSES